MLLRTSALVLVVYGGLLLLTYWSYVHTPKGFVPTQDMGYLLVAFQLPDAASAERTAELAEQVEQVCKSVPGVKNIVTYNGQSFLLSVNGSNFGSMFVMLDDFEAADAGAVRRRDRRPAAEKLAQEVSEAQVVVVGRSPIRGVGRTGGFKFVVEDLGDVGCGGWRTRPRTSWPKATACRGPAAARRWSDSPVCSAPTPRRSTSTWTAGNV